MVKDSDWIGDFTLKGYRYAHESPDSSVIVKSYIQLQVSITVYDVNPYNTIFLYSYGNNSNMGFKAKITNCCGKTTSEYLHFIDQEDDTTWDLKILKRDSSGKILEYSLELSEPGFTPGSQDTIITGNLTRNV